ncbi:MAG TPA: tRNA uridine-5-carboxymethylaminomethyl(34) synthesis GTPase MnmE [Pyrinomonadaceae bacterium]|jgi:tRNA modification GTPase|nr:tRNA uridine-5-carboxymethylaminomethyl(34) synthesis GTPase MnmE [Pyrinomonadaceae bacterium]
MPNTIVALATPTGRSGIGVIRLSGGDALVIMGKLVGDDPYSPEPRFAHLKQLRDPQTGEVIDEAIVTFFKAPHSFTGEDVVEISCHGSPVLLRQVIDICLRLGARMAEAGEFTLRALANGRMNLAEAEAVRDLIDAQTVASARQAVRQLRGEFSNELQPVKDELLDVIVILESALEFVEDDLPVAQEKNIKTRLNDVAAKIEKIAGTFQAGRLIREGLKVALVGRPNVGKSSLFNALLGSERAIVTEIAGTTRDQLHEKFTIGNIPIALIDTAGLRETTDTVESIGVQRSRRTMADADLVIVILDASEELTFEDRKILKSVADLNHIVAVNKIDLLSAECGVQSAELVTPEFRIPHSALRISARTGEGLEELQQAIVQPFTPEDASTAGFLVTDARHHDLLLRAGSEIRHSLELLDQKTSEEITLIGLHNALRYLGQITGETTTEDMLTRIFSTFCIGK